MQPGVGAAGSRSTSSGNGGGRFWTVMTTSLYALLTVWRLAITKINKALLFLDYGWRRRTDFFHKVVLIGDGLPSGFGAWVNLGSLSGLVKHLQESTPQRAGIKTEWAFFERGQLNSTTADWLPGPGGLLERVMGSRACSDVDVVVLLVGLQDLMKIRDPATLVALGDLSEGPHSGLMVSGGGTHGKEWPAEEDEEGQANESKEGAAPADAAATPLVAAGAAGSDAAAAAAVVDNLRVIVEYIVKEKGVHVCLCTPPLVGARTSVRGRAIAGVNRQITAMAKSLGFDKDQLTVVDLGQRRVSNTSAIRSFDGVHFTSAGYKCIAAAVLDELLPHMVRVEWRILQDYVTGRKQRPSACVRWFGSVGGGGGGGNGGGARAGGGGGGQAAAPRPVMSGEGDEGKKGN